MQNPPFSALIGKLKQFSSTPEMEMLNPEMTVLVDRPNKTLKTYKTDSVSNEVFLASIFPGEGDHRPVVCSFPGNPKTVPGKNWHGRPWIPGQTKLSPVHNNYFTLGTFKPDGNGFYRRTKKNFVALYGIMLDDIGTKAAGRERLTIPPSYLIETSEGNYQAGYLFKDPVTDAATAERLIKAVIEAGLCDPGADGPLARYGRLPVAVNGRPDPKFHCRLVEYRPNTRYAVDELVHGLELDMTSGGRPRKKDTAAIYDDETYVPRSESNPVIEKIKSRDLYKRPLGEGKHEILCPWVSGHTGEVDGGTAYFEPNEFYPIGGFKCFHSHCADRHMADLLENLGISKAEAKHRPTIRIAQGELAQIVAHTERELSADGRYFQSGGLIVTVTTDPCTNETKITPLSQPGLVRALSSIVCFEKYDKRSESYTPCDPPDRHCSVLFDMAPYPQMAILRGIARQPYLRPDGTLVTTPGYDQETGMFGVFDEQQFNVPSKPTKNDAEKALQILDVLLSEFSFKKEYDRAAALAGILTATIRPSLPTAPLFHSRAPIISSGKSYLNQLLTAFATMSSSAGVSFPRDEDECRKLLLASLLTNPAVISFDNLTSDLIPHRSLCSALTEEYIMGRILGVSKTATVSTRVLFLSNGNNVAPVRDMTRRTLTISLDPACEHPAARTFQKQPVEMVRAERGKYVSLALTIIRAWICADRPKADLKPLTTYTTWSDLCRQPLVWLGQPDPARSIFETMENDPDRETLGALLSEWHSCFSDTPKMVRDAVPGGTDALREVMVDIAGEAGDINRRRLGRWISRHANRRVNGLYFEKDTSTRSAEAWRAKSVLSVNSVLSSRPTETVTDDEVRL